MPSLRRMSVCGRPPWVMKVSSRVVTRRTLPPALRASNAAINSTLSASVRQPKPPPTCGLIANARHVHVEDLRQHQMDVIGDLSAGVDGHAFALGVVLGD